MRGHLRGPDSGRRLVGTGQVSHTWLGAALDLHWHLGSCSFPSGSSQPWCVSLQVPMSNGPSGSSPGKSEVKLELAFEYLMSKDRLQWVTITSPQVELPVWCAGSGCEGKGWAGPFMGCGKAVGCIEPHDTSTLQAIMLSICLQSMVDELMVKKSGGSIRKVRVGAR